MALITVTFKDLMEDEEHFKKIYGVSYGEFIVENGIDKVVDLTNKVVVALSVDTPRGINTPVNIHQIFIDESKRFGYKAELVYSNHISFLIIKFKSGAKRIFYKDDECIPCEFMECIESGDLLFCAEEKGFSAQDILEQIEKNIQVQHDYNFKIKEENLVLLEGL